MQRKKILFASIPADGHFNPMTGMAMELKEQGHDVRWYTSKMFAGKLNELGITHYRFKKALEANQFNADELFPERKKIKVGAPRLKFDLKHFFIYRAPEYFQDIREIRQVFDFDVFVCDAAFTAGKLVKESLNVPAVAVGIVPVMSSSKDLPPYGLGLTPGRSVAARMKQSILRFMAKNFLFKESTNEYNKILKQHGLAPEKMVVFDIPALRSNVFLQSGTPGFEYERSDLPEKLKFVGPLHAYKEKKQLNHIWENRLTEYRTAILITQGTFEGDHSKLIIPALEALKDEPYLLMVATGFHHTEELRRKYQKDNIVIEDFIDFDSIMPNTDIYITNGGYGGVLLGIEHGLPMIAAGINEGKNEICARIGFFKLGINLKTEKPSAQKISESVKKILSDPRYKKNVSKLSDEFNRYDTNKLCANYILSASNGSI